MFSSFSRSQRVMWAMWVIASIFYAYQYVLRVMPNIMLEDIMRQFGLSAATFGQFSGVYYIGYSMMHLPVGLMLDRYGPKKVMTACIFLTVIGLMPLLFADHWIYPIVGRFLVGLGSSAAILGVFKIIRMAFSEKRFPRMLSLSVTIGLIGAIYGGGPVSYLCKTLGYQAVIQILALSGVVLALITYWIVPHSKGTVEGTVASHIKEVLSNKRVIGLCISAGLMVGPLEGFADVWAAAFLKQVYGFEDAMAASLPSLIFIGMCFGAPILNWIAEKARSYQLTIIGAGVIMGIGFFLLLFWDLTPMILTLSFLVVGVCCSYQILAIYQASTYVREQVAGLTTAVANMIIMLFGYAFHAVIGVVINATGGPQTSQALTYGVTAIPVALVLGIGGFSFLFTKKAAQENAL